MRKGIKKRKKSLILHGWESREQKTFEEYENENYYLLWWSDKRHFPYNCLGLSEEKKTYQRAKNLSYCMAGKVENKKIEEYTECKYGGPLGRRPGRVMKVRLVRPRCFVLTMLPLKSLASWTGSFISLCLLVFVFLNASRRDRNCPTFASTGKQWIHGIRWDEGSE